MKEKDYFELFMKIILFILVLIGLYMIILKLIGRSPTLDEINFTLITILISSLILFVYKFGRFQGNVEEFIMSSKNSFVKIRDDMTNLNNNLNTLRRKR